MPDFSRRDHAPEWMDDLSITDERLTAALDELRHVNRWLGGDRPSLQALRGVKRGEQLRVLDVGAGGGDFLEALARWSRREELAVVGEGIDLNPATVAYAARRLEAALPAAQRADFHVRVADAFALPYADGSFDVAHAGLFLHHFDDAAAVRLLREMRRVARVVVVNDLHRHPVAYHSIALLARLLRASPMFRADAPHSVLRAFSRAELERLARAAGLEPEIRWRWAFRWLLIAS